MPTSSSCTVGRDPSCFGGTWRSRAGRCHHLALAIPLPAPTFATRCSSGSHCGFIVSDFYPQRLLPIRAELAALLRAKRLRVVVSEFEGLERAPDALATVFDRGSPYIGRRVVRTSEG